MHVEALKVVMNELPRGASCATRLRRSTRRQRSMNKLPVGRWPGDMAAYRVQGGGAGLDVRRCAGAGAGDRCNATASAASTPMGAVFAVRVQRGASSRPAARAVDACAAQRKKVLGAALSISDASKSDWRHPLRGGAHRLQCNNFSTLTFASRRQYVQCTNAPDQYRALARVRQAQAQRWPTLMILVSDLRALVAKDKGTDGTRSIPGLTGIRTINISVHIAGQPVISALHRAGADRRACAGLTIMVSAARVSS